MGSIDGYVFTTISMFYTSIQRLKSFGSLMCPLNLFQTYIKNFNRHFSLEYAEKNGKVQTAKKIIKTR